ncbi:signal recognition particle subunit SRP68-like [Zophobas morio]|jgi:hypothetical protein|uniref:signal recognition particle subunit SRP68-like n=1 Tax=Zophobas morio TaxID=2755281 RepID=UPI003083B540
MVQPYAGHSSSLSGVFRVEVFVLITRARNQHGLKHGLYDKYRQYCTRRLRRLRVALKLRCGKKKFIFKNLSVENSDSRYLEVLLLEVERCWSYGMQLKQNVERYPRKKFHMIRKFRKCYKYCQLLLDCSSMGWCDALTAQEIKAYTATLCGSSLFEQADYSEALTLFSSAKAEYDQLVLANPSQKELYASSILAFWPKFRYAAMVTGSSLPELPSVELNSFYLKIESIAEGTSDINLNALKEIDWQKIDFENHTDNLPFFTERLKTLKELHLLEMSDIELKEELAVHTCLASSYRQFFIGSKLEHEKNFALANGLYQKAIESAENGLLLARSFNQHNPTYSAALYELLKNSKKRKCTVKARSYLSRKELYKKSPLAENLDEFHDICLQASRAPFVDIVGPMQVLPLKPYFYDLAGLQISLEDDLSSLENQNKESFVSRFLNWRLINS